jgi:hypothetical protein
MSPALLLGLALSAPPAEAEARLVEVALRAKRAGDAALVRRALRGWASLKHHPALPAGIEAEAADATSWAMSSGYLRIYGSRLPGRVRVGVDDPALIVGRLDVFIQDPSGQSERARLTRAESEAAGRNEYLVPESASEREIVVEAVMTDFGDELVLRRSILAPASGTTAPERPDPKRAAEKLGFEEEIAPPPAEETPVFAWWWIAIGVAAAGLAGAAIYQEAKD